MHEFPPLPDNGIVSGPSFWELLAGRDRDGLLAAAGSRKFAADAVLCMEGDPTTHLFILLSGWVKVTNVTRDGREILVALYGSGSVFGEIAGRVTGYRTATVRAIGPVRALVIGAERFEDFLDAHPAAARAYRQAIAQGQQAAYEYQRNQALSSGAQRLACLLLDLVGQEGTPSPDRSEIAAQLSQEELASLISASRSTVTRALHDWRSRQIISTDQRRIEILDRMRLLRIAGRLVPEALCAPGPPFSAFVPDPPQKRGPLSRGKREDRAPVAGVPDQHRRPPVGYFYASAICSAGATLAPGQHSAPDWLSWHSTSLRSTGPPLALTTRG